MLTVTEIKGLKPKTKAYYAWDKTGERGTGTLGVQVTPKGTKRFVFRFFIYGKAQFIQLGQFPELSLISSREKKKELGLMLTQGVNPKESLEATRRATEHEKREETRKGSIEQLFNAYTAQMAKDGKRTYKAVLKALEQEVYPHLAPTTKAKNVTSHDLILILASMIKRGAVTQSNRVRSYLMAAFNYGLKHDHDPANFIDDAKFGLAINPVTAIPKQKDGERIGEHYLTTKETKQLLSDLEHEYSRFKMGDSVRNLIALCFYTGGQRPYELIASKWSAVDWEQKTLLIPAEISKNKRPHLIPLTQKTLEILQRQYDTCTGSPYIFPHRLNTVEHMRTDSLAQGITRYRENTPTIRPFVPRDIRRTCKTLMGEIGLSKDIRDRLQNHALNDVSSKHYDRYEYLPEKLGALRAWEHKLNEAVISNIVSLKFKE